MAEKKIEKKDNYSSLYNKYRPKSLESMLGNEDVVAQLKRHIQDDTLPQVVMFFGPPGCGKTTLARILKGALKCEDMNFTELNVGNTRGIDTIREVIDSSQYAAFGGGVKIFLFDECFARNTKIELGDGSKLAIERIVRRFRNGEKFIIKTKNLNTGEIEPKLIVDVFSKPYRGEFCHLVVQGGDEFKCTPKHKILTPKGFIEARFLKTGDRVVQKAKLDAFRLSAVRGMVLGDGSIATKLKNGRLRLVHGQKQKEYLVQKRNLLKNFTRQEIRPSPSGFSDQKVLCFSTLSCGQLYEIGKEFYVNNKKVINQDTLSKLDDASLAFWYMDDGSLSPSRTIQLHTECFSKEENEIICSWLKTYLFSSDHKKKHSRTVTDRMKYNFRINTTPDEEVVVEKQKQYYFIRLNRLATDLFLKRVSKFMYPCMQFKTYYQATLKNPDFVENTWAAEILEAWTSKPKFEETVYDLTIGVPENSNFLVSQRQGTVVSNCHRFTADAQNGLLKLLEDTPRGVYYFLCTTEPQKLVKPLRQRQICKYEVKPIGKNLMDELLKMVSEEEGAGIPEESVLDAIFSVSEGSPRLALTTLEQVFRLPPDRAVAVIEGIEYGCAEAKEMIEISRALTYGQGWGAVQSLLRQVDITEPERARAAVAGYFVKVLVGSDPKPGEKPRRTPQQQAQLEDRAARMLGHLGDSVIYSGLPGLTLQLWRCAREK